MSQISHQMKDVYKKGPDFDRFWNIKKTCP